MAPDAGPPAGCVLCGREIGSKSVDAETEGVFCSTGCRDVCRTMGPAQTTRGGEATGLERGAEETGAGSSGDEIEREPEGINTFLRIDGMYSATCEAFLESVANKQEGVYDAAASYVTETIRVSHDTDLLSKTELRDALSTLGYTAYLRETVSDESAGTDSTTRQAREMGGVRKRQDDQILEFRYAAGLLFGAFLLVPYVSILYPTHLASLVDWAALSVFEGALDLGGQGGFMFLRIYLVLTGVILFFTGLPVLRGAYVGLKMRQPNTDLLVAATAVSAYLYSTVAVLVGRIDIFYDVTVIVAAAVTAATFYESSVKQRALSRLTELTVSQVDTARVYDPSDGETTVGVDELASGDRVLVKQGERIPVDGTLLESDCTVDEAVVTGESLPVLKRPGETVLGGSIVTDDAAIVEVGAGATSSIDRITTAVWKLQSADHGVKRRADRLAVRVIWLLGAAAVLVGGAAIVLGVGPIGIVRRVLLVLLVWSPWALGLATPLSVATSLEAALRRGIVIFDETVFERLRDIDTVVFDKTGTLTTGEMDVIEADAPAALLDAVAELERRASHPAANAIVTAFGRDGGRDGDVRTDGGENEDGEDRGRGADAGSENGTDRDREHTGRISEFTTHATGIEGVVDGTTVLIGTLGLFDELGWTVDAEIESRVVESRGFGRLPVVVGWDGTAEGLIVVGDEPREGWDDALTRLGERGTDIVVLTGDDEEATAFFSRHPHVTHVFASVPPEGKTATIRRLRAEGSVAMVGDGTNDAPALAAADLGISLGGGTALAADAADIAIADDEIGSVETAFDLAGAANRRVTQNIGVALVYNVIAVSAVALGVFNPLTAAVAVLACGGLLVANSSRRLVDAPSDSSFS